MENDDKNVGLNSEIAQNLNNQQNADTEKNIDTETETFEQNSSATEEKNKNNKKLIRIIGIAVCALLIAICAFVIGTSISNSKIVSISASYHGDREHNVVLNEENSGITVVGTKKNGEEKEITNWTIEKEKTLEDDTTTNIKILYKDLSCNLTVRCTSSAVNAITISYTGSTKDGTKINKDTNGLTVTAHHKDGSETDVTDECEISEVVLKRDETVDIKATYLSFSDQITVECSDVSVVKITATYTGATSAGTKISEGNSDVTVTAELKNGKTKKISDWKLKEAIVLKEDTESVLEISYEGQTCQVKVVCSTMSKEKYKEKCESISYSELARNPQSYKGRLVKFRGKIIQVLEEEAYGLRFANFRVNTKYGYSTYTDDTIFVTYFASKDDARFLENDVITIYGEYDGLYTYETIFGASVTIPKIKAEYIER